MFVNHSHLPQEVRGLFLNGQNEAIKVRGDVKHVVKVQAYPQCFSEAGFDAGHEMKAREVGIVGTLISLSSNENAERVDMNVVFVNRVASIIIYTAKGTKNVLTLGQFDPNSSFPECPMYFQAQRPLGSFKEVFSPEEATQDAVQTIVDFLK